MAQKVTDTPIIDDKLIDELIGSNKTADDLFGQDGILKQLTKQLMERMLESELTHHLGYEKYESQGHHTGNSRNGQHEKTVKTGNGEVRIKVPRYRKSEFAPKLIEKRQSRLRGIKFSSQSF